LYSNNKHIVPERLEIIVIDEGKDERYETIEAKLVGKDASRNLRALAGDINEIIYQAKIK
jgi:hypothetical protein